MVQNNQMKFIVEANLDIHSFIHSPSTAISRLLVVCRAPAMHFTGVLHSSAPFIQLISFVFLLYQNFG